MLTPGGESRSWKSEELEQIKKLLDPYAERIREFYKRIHRAPEEEEMIDSERRERGSPHRTLGQG